MPVVAAIVGAIMTGLLWWLMWGKGMEYIDSVLRDHQARKRRERVRKEIGTPPLKALKDPREAATALMIQAALARGVMTPEQEAAIQEQMRTVLAFGPELEDRFKYCKFAAEQAQTPEMAIEDVVELLRKSLEPAEREDLRRILERVVAVHGGPTERQENFVERAMRRLSEET